MKRLVGISALLFLAAALHFVSYWGAGYAFILSASSTEIGGENLYVKAIVHNIDIKVESSEFSTHFNPFSSPSKNLKKSITPLAFTEQYATGHLKHYNLGVKNLLIKSGRKAIFFPFHYFW